MDQISAAIRQMISISDEALTGLLQHCVQQTFKRKAILSRPNKGCNEIYFINKGIILG